MYKAFVKLGIVLAIGAMIFIMSLGSTGVSASTSQQATMAATNSMTSAMTTVEGACPVGLAAQMSARMATQEPGMSSTAPATIGTASPTLANTMQPTMTVTQAAMLSGTQTSLEPICFVAPMTGLEEVPPGAPKGTGFAAITIDPVKNQITFDVVVAGIKLPATAMHIHAADAGSAGPVVVPALKFPDASGAVTTTTSNVDAALIAKILTNPEGYYVNVHNADFPGGAVRGQLTFYNNTAGMSPTMAATASK